MADSITGRTQIEIPWRTILKILAAAALVWCVFQLYSIILLMIVATLLAVTLDPLVEWLGRWKLGRTAAASLVVLGLLVLCVSFFWITGATLVEQSHQLADRFGHIQRRLSSNAPSWLPRIPSFDGTRVSTLLTTYGLQVAESTVTAMTILVFGLVVTLYLLVDGRRTYEWLLAFVPLRHRARAEQTAEECRTVMYGYVVGNAITSVIAFACTLVALVILHVPAALLLSLMAGLSDFVPVIGFIISAIPAILLALTVSPTTALIVIAFYIVYNTVENYLISPWAYGDRLKLSDTAVILGFAAGAELAGVIGALIALPVVAMYPTVEKIWLHGRLPEETLREHNELQE